MKEGFRQSMAWLHTWTGLVVGWVLFFVFLTGTVGYIQDELTRYMQPERPLQSQNPPPIDQQMQKAYQWLKNNPDLQGAERWGISFISNHRGSDDLNINWSMPPAKGESYGQYGRQVLDPFTGQIPAAEVKPRETGGGALYEMHYALHYMPYDWAIRIVGICTMLMFVAIITGIITHKKIFKDFFTFRGAKGQRSWLNAHNVLSVIALPFHIMITYSGLIFFMTAYMPLGVPLTYGFDEGERRYYAELYPRNSNSDQNKTPIFMGQVAPDGQQIQTMLKKVEQQWGQSNIGNVSFYTAKGDQSARAEFYKAKVEHIGRSAGKSLSFDLQTGEQLSPVVNDREKGTLKFGTVMLGLHVGWFATPFLRWMYVLTGFIGTAMIATGLVLWTVKRRPKQIKNGKMSFGHALVERLNIGMVAGLPLGIAVYFWANRLLPVAMEGRAAWEIHSLFIAMFLVFIYSFLRPIGKAWFEALAVTAVALLLLPILNYITTDKHMWATFVHGDWVLFSIDVGFILTGLFFAWVSYFVWKKQNAILKPVAKKPREVKATINSTSTVEDA